MQSAVIIYYLNWDYKTLHNRMLLSSIPTYLPPAAHYRERIVAFAESPTPLGPDDWYDLTATCHHIPSINPGDLVILNGQVHLCLSFGWADVTDDYQARASSFETIPTRVHIEPVPYTPHPTPKAILQAMLDQTRQARDQIAKLDVDPKTTPQIEALVALYDNLLAFGQRTVELAKLQSIRNG